MTTSNTFPALKNDLILRVARGQEAEDVPVWVMRQAGRYDPEFKAVRAKHDFFTICRTPELACQVTLQPIQRYSGLLDAAIIFSDILVVPQALGLVVEMYEGKGGPFFPQPIREPADLARLKEKVNVEEELGYVYKAITMTRHALNGQVPLFGFAGAPWTLMAYMIEGGGSKLFSKVKRWLFALPEESHFLLQKITDVVVEFLVGQVIAGAQILQVFDSWAGELSPHHFREFSLPYLKQIATRVKATLKERGHDDVPMVVFAKGAHEALADLADAGYDVVSLDWTIDPVLARERTSNKVVLQGNADPGILYGTPELIDREVGDMIERFKRHRWIANLGHGMQPDHTPEGLDAFLRALKKRTRA